MVGHSGGRRGDVADVFEPGLSYDHLGVLVQSLHEMGLPAALWRTIEPWAHQPRHYDHARKYGLDKPTGMGAGSWLAEIHAPIRWDRAFPALGMAGEVALAHDASVLGQLCDGWGLLTEFGLAPAVVANIGVHEEVWLVQLQAVTAVGDTRPMDVGAIKQVSATLCGQIAGIASDFVCWRLEDSAAL